MHLQLSSELYLKFLCMLGVWNLRTHSPVAEEMRLREKGPACKDIASCSRAGTRIRPPCPQATLLFTCYCSASVSK